jgi:hypothetical protein
VRDEIGRLPLNQLREARSVTQTILAESLRIPQGAFPGSREDASD